MQRYSGFREYGYRFEVKVPTTIYDPRHAEISAYKGSRLADKVYFRLSRMPRWDVPAQCIMLSKRDEKKLEQKTEELFHRLGIREGR